MYYVYEYVPDLTEGEKNYLKKKIKEADSNGKYREMIEDTISEKENCEAENGRKNKQKFTKVLIIFLSYDMIFLN